MRPQLTKIQKAALRSLKEHGGEGAIAKKHGHVIAAGCVLGSYNEREDETGEQLIPFSRQTWAALKELGLIESAGTGRIRISKKGEDYT
jgi:hypothetical protein